MFNFKTKRENKSFEDEKKADANVAPKTENSASSPFQAIVTKEDKEFVNHDLMREISMETLKSPIVTTAATVSAKPIQAVEDEEIEFTPRYILENDISSISELKELIAKKRPPKISFVLNNDLSCISKSERESLDKINSLDTRKILNAIRKNIEDIESPVKRQAIPHKYKIACVSALSNPKQEVTVKKYLSADEIIAQRRKEAEEKKIKTAAFLAQKTDMKSMEDLAKLYYESDIEEYDND